MIQDEIKALVQLQNRQASIQSNTELSPTPVSKMTTNTKDYIYPPFSTDRMLPKNVSSDNINLETRAILDSPHTPQSSETPNHAKERAATVLSSGYGTLSTWDAGLEPAQSPGDDQCEKRQTGKNGRLSNDRKDTETLVTGSRQHFNSEETLKVKTANQLVHQQRAVGYVWGFARGNVILLPLKSYVSVQNVSAVLEKLYFLCFVRSSSNVLTSWAQRQKLRTKKTKTGQNLSRNPEYLEKPCGFRESPKKSPQGTDSEEQVRLTLMQLLHCVTSCGR